MAGLKYSRQREAVLTYLRSTKSHPTAETVYLTLRDDFPKISLGTVYRNLNLLAEQGEILRIRCGDGIDHFDATMEPHSHFICRSCGKIYDLEMTAAKEIDREAEKQCSGKIEGHELYFYGTCEQCLQKK
jgi:Fur family peroxide stress response transcriptional regulator